MPLVETRTERHGHRHGREIGGMVREADQRLERARQRGDGAEVLGSRRHGVRRHAVQQHEGARAGRTSRIHGDANLVEMGHPGGHYQRLAGAGAALDERQEGQVPAGDLVGIDAHTLEHVHGGKRERSGQERQAT